MTPNTSCETCPVHAEMARLGEEMQGVGAARQDRQRAPIRRRRVVERARGLMRETVAQRGLQFRHATRRVHGLPLGRLSAARP